MSTTGPTEHVGPPPPFDPALEGFLADITQVIPASITPEMIPSFRSGLPGMEGPSDAELARDGQFEVFELSVAGPPDEADVPLLVCRPRGSDTPTPALYQIHGGGMVMGDRRTGLADVLDLAAAVGAAVISVEYRLAPEHRHPAPVEDCYAGLVWVAANAASLNVAADRIVIAGSSSGGGLAAAVALMARDSNGPSLAGQMLMAPMLDDRNDSPSAVQMTGSGMWDRISNTTGWSALLDDTQGTPNISPYAAPARATVLSGLPPAFIYGGSAETFRDEDVAYASAIWRAGGQAELHVWSGGFHGFDLMVPQAAISRAAKAARESWIRRVFDVPDL